MSKLPKVGTSIFSVMSKMAADHQAINLSQGFPNFSIDPRLKEAQEKVVRNGLANQYCPMAGLPTLMEQIAITIKASYQKSIDVSSELLITAGATQAIYTILQSLVYPGDEVLILDPCYDCYDPAIVMSGGIAKHISLNDDYTPNWDLIEKSINAKTRILITNNPHNPSGRIWTPSDFEALEQIAEKHPQLLILSDEVYEYITFEQKHISIHQRPKLADRAISVSSFGKTFHITGWKIGYIVAPKQYMDEIKKVHQFLVFCVNSVSQHTLAAYMQEVNVQELGAFYQQKRDYFQSLIKDSRFELLPSEGTYFQLASYSQISNEKDVDFTQRLILEHKIATIPVSVFNDDGKDLNHIRFCFAKTDETLEQAAEILRSI